VEPGGRHWRVSVVAAVVGVFRRGFPLPRVNAAGWADGALLVIVVGILVILWWERYRS
jgi:hypothetical protein